MTQKLTSDFELELELVSEELNHLALHVYARGLIFMTLKKKNIIIFQKEEENTFTL